MAKIVSKFSTDTHAHAAYHEAGHFVVGVEVGIPVTGAKLSGGTDGTLGAVADSLTNSIEHWDLKAGNSPEDLPGQLSYLMYLLAGQVAEEVFTGRPNPEGAGKDNDELREVAFDVCGRCDEEAEALAAWARLRVRNILLQPLIWAKVAAVADQLLQSGELDREAGLAVCDRWEPKSLADAARLNASIPPAWEKKRVGAERRIRAAVK